ncbi:uncharacterized protein [Asterias amurensis]|uniref:uncharacterized protein n=1 Tax=Asterias amurensis TaxID=7602 RepID=UPI003AB238C2
MMQKMECHRDNQSSFEDSCGWPATDGPVHAHEVRGVSASWAFFKGVSMSDITRAASWKSPSTFSDCYLKDVLQVDGRADRAVYRQPAELQNQNKLHLVSHVFSALKSFRRLAFTCKPMHSASTQINHPMTSQ